MMITPPRREIIPQHHQQQHNDNNNVADNYDGQQHVYSTIPFSTLINWRIMF